MSGRVTFSATSKGAFRVEVAGAGSRNISRLLLAGHGDERSLELADGRYNVDVTNIGTGARHSLSFDVQASAPESMVNVGSDRPRRATWRSAAGGSWRPEGWLAAKRGKTSSSDRNASTWPMLRTRTPLGWRAFAGTIMTNSDLPMALKIVRPGAWSARPLVRIELPGRDGESLHSFVPLFSGGTLIRWSEDGGRLLDMVPCEPKSAAIVGALAYADRNELSDILTWAAGSDEADAVQLVMHSRDDPWIAAAAGLLLIGSGSMKRSASSLSRLAARQSFIADLGVLAAWGRAVDNPEEEVACLNCLAQARRGGIVFFWHTLTIGDRLLTALASGAKSGAVRAQAREELGHWKKLNMAAFKVGVCSGWLRPSQNARRAAVR